MSLHIKLYKYKKSCSILLSLITSFLAYSICSSYDKKTSVLSSRKKNLEEKLGLKKNWLLISKKPIEDHDKIMTAKIIFTIDSRKNNQRTKFVVNKKRSKGKNKQRKNKLLEFPGGKIDPGERPLAALLREIREEDPSGGLASSLEEDLNYNKKAKYKIIRLKNGERHFVVKCPMSFENWKKLEAHWNQKKKKTKEVRTISLVSLKTLDIKNNHHELLWTPKSRKILNALRFNSI